MAPGGIGPVHRAVAPEGTPPSGSSGKPVIKNPAKGSLKQIKELFEQKDKKVGPAEGRGPEVGALAGRGGGGLEAGSGKIQSREPDTFYEYTRRLDPDQRAEVDRDLASPSRVQSNLLGERAPPPEVVAGVRDGFLTPLESATPLFQWAAEEVQEKIDRAALIEALSTYTSTQLSALQRTLRTRGVLPPQGAKTSSLAIARSWVDGELTTKECLHTLKVGFSSTESTRALIRLFPSWLAGPPLRLLDPQEEAPPELHYRGRSPPRSQEWSRWVADEPAHALLFRMPLMEGSIARYLMDRIDLAWGVPDPQGLPCLWLPTLSLTQRYLTQVGPYPVVLRPVLGLSSVADLTDGDVRGIADLTLPYPWSSMEVLQRSQDAPGMQALYLAQLYAFALSATSPAERGLIEYGYTTALRRVFTGPDGLPPTGLSGLFLQELAQGILLPYLPRLVGESAEQMGVFRVAEVPEAVCHAPAAVGWHWLFVMQSWMDAMRQRLREAGKSVLKQELVACRRCLEQAHTVYPVLEDQATSTTWLQLPDEAPNPFASSQLARYQHHLALPAPALLAWGEQLGESMSSS